MFGFGEIAEGGSSGNMPAAAPIGSIIRARDDRNRRRAEEEARRQQRNEAVLNYGNETDAYNAERAYLAENPGKMPADYLSSGLVMATDRDQIGGAALESILQQAGGYNPTMAYNPYLQVTASDRNAVAAAQQQGQQLAESALSGWEGAMSDLAGEYETARQAQISDRDEMADNFATAVADEEAQDTEAMAQHIVEQWIDSNSAQGAEGGFGNFVDRRGNSRRNARGRGRVRGADEGAKRDYIQDLLANGNSYEQILEHMAGYISEDPNTAALYGSYVSENATPEVAPDPEDQWNRYGGFY